jgi:thiosulfate dehydrogenase
MTIKEWTILAGVTTASALVSTSALVAAQAVSRAPAAVPKHQLPTSRDGDLVVGLCDGETAMEVDGVKAGQPMDPARAQTVAATLMAEWRRKNPQASWDDTRLVAQTGQDPPSPRSPTLIEKAKSATDPGSSGVTAGDTASTGARQVPRAKAANVQSGHTYKNFSERDHLVWKASTDAFVERGNRVFHDAKEVGGTTGMSCDMCHPDGTNTHPETYPKYQVQLGRVAMLRDMINWCIENPVRGKPLPDSDERLRAMEAYIYAQRKGVALEYGKH